MRELKLQLNIYSPRDYLRIQQHLSAMAEKGWMLEQIDRFFWRYRICEPKKLRFSVLFFQNLDWEEPYREQAEAAGWKFVSGFAGMQIFCTEDPDLAAIEIDPTPRWKAIHTAARTRDRILWLGMSLMALIVLASSGITAASDPIEVLADGPRLMYAVLMVTGLIFVLVDMIHYFTWRNKARRQFHKVGTLPEPKGNLVGICVGLGIMAAMLIAILVLEDNYGRIVTLLNVLSIAAALLVAAGYRLLRKRKSADIKVRPVGPIALALLTFLLLGMVQSALLNNMDFTCQPEDMALTVQQLETEAEDGSCLIEEQNSPFITDLYGRNIVGEGESQMTLQYRVMLPKNGDLVDFVHERCLPAEYHTSAKLEQQDAAAWKAEKVWMQKAVLKEQASADEQAEETPAEEARYIYTYFIYYQDRAAHLKVNWELTPEQIAIATEALTAAS